MERWRDQGKKGQGAVMRQGGRNSRAEEQDRGMGSGEEEKQERGRERQGGGCTDGETKRKAGNRTKGLRNKAKFRSK